MDFLDELNKNSVHHYTEHSVLLEKTGTMSGFHALYFRLSPSLELLSVELTDSVLVTARTPVVSKKRLSTEICRIPSIEVL